jgi:hypothetical protein
LRIGPAAVEAGVHPAAVEPRRSDADHAAPRVRTALRIPGIPDRASFDVSIYPTGEPNMKIVLAAMSSVFLATSALAQVNPAPTRVPEPEMWALVGVAVAAIGIARFISRK